MTTLKIWNLQDELIYKNDNIDDLLNQYEIDKDAPVSGEGFKQAKEELIRSNKIGLRPTGRDILKVLADRFGYDNAKKIGRVFLKRGVLVPEEEQSGEGEYGGAVTSTLDYQEQDPRWTAHDLTKGGTDIIGTA